MLQAKYEMLAEMNRAGYCEDETEFKIVVECEHSWVFVSGPSDEECVVGQFFKPTVAGAGDYAASPFFEGDLADCLVYLHNNFSADAVTTLYKESVVPELNKALSDKREELLRELAKVELAIVKVAFPQESNLMKLDLMSRHMEVVVQDLNQYIIEELGL